MVGRAIDMRLKLGVCVSDQCMLLTSRAAATLLNIPRAAMAGPCCMVPAEAARADPLRANHTTNTYQHPAPAITSWRQAQPRSATDAA